MEQAIDSFIRFLAVERGLSENYQLSTQRSLSEFAQWCVAKKKIDNLRAVSSSAHQRISGRPQTLRAFCLFDQIDCGCTEDFLPIFDR